MRVGIDSLLSSISTFNCFQETLKELKLHNQGPSTVLDCCSEALQCYNHTNAPCQHTWPSPGPRPLTQPGYNLVSTKSPLTKSKKRKNCRELSNIKANVSMHWLAQCKKLQRSSREFQHPAGIKLKLPISLLLTLLSTEPYVHIYWLKKTV